MATDLWLHFKCPICGKEFALLSCEEYTWKFKFREHPYYFCSYTCRQKALEDKRRVLSEEIRDKVEREREIARRYYHNKKERTKNETKH